MRQGLLLLTSEDTCLKIGDWATYACGSCGSFAQRCLSFALTARRVIHRKGVPVVDRHKLILTIAPHNMRCEKKDMKSILTFNSLVDIVFLAARSGEEH